MSLQIVLALAAPKLAELGIDRPVHCRWSREESIVGHHKRHRARSRPGWGPPRTARSRRSRPTLARRRGLQLHLEQGARQRPPQRRGAYRDPNARIDSRPSTPTAVPGGAFRGFGGPQGCFVAESQMNKLADAPRHRPVELRRRNVLREGSDRHHPGPAARRGDATAVIDACAADGRLERAARRAGTVQPDRPLPIGARRCAGAEASPAATRTSAFQFGFPERCEAEIHLHRRSSGSTTAERADVFHGGAEVGQGPTRPSGR